MADPNTPSWLSDNTTQQPYTAQADAPRDSLAPAPNASVTSKAPSAAEDSTTPDDPELPGVILMMRLMNMGVAAGMIIISVLRVINLTGSWSGHVLAIYAVIGSTLICCLETQLKFVRVMIAVNFGFLFSSFWRFLFYLLMSSIAMSFGGPLGFIVGSCFVAVALYNTYVLCRYPSYRRVRDKIAEEEDKRIEARISKEVKRQMVQQAMK